MADGTLTSHLFSPILISLLGSALLFCAILFPWILFSFSSLLLFSLLFSPVPFSSLVFSSLLSSFLFSDQSSPLLPPVPKSSSCSLEVYILPLLNCDLFSSFIFSLVPLSSFPSSLSSSHPIHITLCSPTLSFHLLCTCFFRPDRHGFLPYWVLFPSSPTPLLLPALPSLRALLTLSVFLALPSSSPSFPHLSSLHFSSFPSPCLSSPLISAPLLSSLHPFSLPHFSSPLPFTPFLFSHLISSPLLSHPLLSSPSPSDCCFLSFNRLLYPPLRSSLPLLGLYLSFTHSPRRSSGCLF